MFKAQIQMAGGPQETHLAFDRTDFMTLPPQLPTHQPWRRSHTETGHPAQIGDPGPAL